MYSNFILTIGSAPEFICPSCIISNIIFLIIMFIIIIIIVSKSFPSLSVSRYFSA